MENTPPKQALELGLSVHQMAATRRDRARELYQILDGFRPLTAGAFTTILKTFPNEEYPTPHQLRRQAMDQTWGLRKDSR